MKFNEPEKTKTVSISVILETFPIKPEDKEWICDLLIKNEIPGELQSDLKYHLEELIKKSDEKDANSFRVLFLFDHTLLTIFCDCFDENKLLSEKIKIISELFTQKAEGKPSTFKHYIVYIFDNTNILNNIRSCAEKDKKISESYQKNTGNSSGFFF
jgi:hypothetical protein